MIPLLHHKGSTFITVRAHIVWSEQILSKGLTVGYKRWQENVLTFWHDMKFLIINLNQLTETFCFRSLWMQMKQRLPPY